MSIKKTNDGQIRVRYLLKEEKDFVSVVMTPSQFENLQELPIIEKCEIIQKIVLQPKFSSFSE